MLGWEYATLAHCRSAASIAFLPKLNVLYFLAAHGTFYAVARPYALLNCGVAALFMCHATLYCILELELPALVRGDIDATITPRARRTELPWPALDAMLPPTWSLYMPLVPNDDDQFPEEDDVGTVAAADRLLLPRMRMTGVELVDLNRAPAPAVATDSPRLVFFLCFSRRPDGVRGDAAVSGDLALVPALAAAMAFKGRRWRMCGLAYAIDASRPR